MARKRGNTLLKTIFVLIALTVVICLGFLSIIENGTKTIKHEKYAVKIPITDQEIKLQLKHWPFSRAKDDIKSVAPSLVIEAQDGLGQKIIKYPKPFEIKFDFSQTDLSNTDPETLSFYFYNPESGSWDIVLTRIDKSKKTASTYRQTFGQYSLMGKLKDISSPQTKINIKGRKNGNSYSGPVTVELLANDGESGLGIFQTIYTLDDKEWIEYTSPIELLNSGTYNIQFMSIDKAGNEEGVQTSSFNLN